ncbi:MAG TPA: Hsp20/alpha crystallin family protein [Acidimicrobiales bacterium]|nr:Hsp20/alpha crystallin family protein [Acidimicrobiales bacterium]
MARDLVRTGRAVVEWPPLWPTVRRWMDLFEEDGIIRVEEVMEGDTLVIRAELPGVDPDKDVDISVENGVLTLHAERRDETVDKDRRRSEFRYGSFSRSLTLPVGATEDDVKATFADGILEVRVPVSRAKAQSTKIPVTKV